MIPFSNRDSKYLSPQKHRSDRVLPGRVYFDRLFPAKNEHLPSDRGKRQDSFAGNLRSKKPGHSSRVRIKQTGGLEWKRFFPVLPTGVVMVCRLPG